MSWWCIDPFSILNKHLEFDLYQTIIIIIDKTERHTNVRTQTHKENTVSVEEVIIRDSWGDSLLVGLHALQT